MRSEEQERTNLMGMMKGEAILIKNVLSQFYSEKKEEAVLWVHGLDEPKEGDRIHKDDTNENHPGSWRQGFKESGAKQLQTLMKQIGLRMEHLTLFGNVDCREGTKRIPRTIDVSLAICVWHDYTTATAFYVKFNRFNDETIPVDLTSWRIRAVWGELCGTSDMSQKLCSAPIFGHWRNEHAYLIRWNRRSYDSRRHSQYWRLYLSYFEDINVICQVGPGMIITSPLRPYFAFAWVIERPKSNLGRMGRCNSPRWLRKHSVRRDLRTPPYIRSKYVWLWRDEVEECPQSTTHYVHQGQQGNRQNECESLTASFAYPSKVYVVGFHLTQNL